MSSFRGESNILAICYRPKTVRHLALSYGVYAIFMPLKSYGHEFLLAALRKLLADNLLHMDDRICYLGSQRKDEYPLEAFRFFMREVYLNKVESCGEPQ